MTAWQCIVPTCTLRHITALTLKCCFRPRRWKLKCAELAASPAGGNAAAAALVGKRVAEKALKAGITEVAFDRSGFRYHGRVKALAEAAREAGLKF